MTMQTGTITKWNDDKGFGFIKPRSGGKDIFIHITGYSKEHKKPVAGLMVNYFHSTDARGRKCAVDVRPVNGHKNNGRALRQKSSALIICSIFFISLFLFSSLKLIPFVIVAVYFVMSVITFIMYAKDKNSAQNGNWRTPESTLQLLSLLGGWPGAAIAQSYLRHKSKKISFRFVYWITVIVNCFGLYWITTPQGQMWVNNVLRNINLG